MVPRNITARQLMVYSAVFAVLSIAGIAQGADMLKPDVGEAVAAPAPLEHGFEAGNYVPEFYSRVVTGPLMNKTICYVCRSGRRPVVMVLMRDIRREHRPLLKNIDRFLEINRGGGLRGFGVMLSEDPFRSISKVQTFSYNHKLDMPLTVAPLSVGNEGNRNLPPDAEITVVLYRNRRVQKAISFRTGELTYERTIDVISAVREFISENVSNPSQPSARSETQ